MDDRHWFDTLHRTFVREVDRRGFLRATTAIAASLVSSAAPRAATAKNRKQKGKGGGNGTKKGKGQKKGNGKQQPQILPAEDFCDDASDEGNLCLGDCGVCRSGTCSPAANACPPCQYCDPTFKCVPLPDDTGCIGPCGRCKNGQCLPQGTLCSPYPCQSCQPDTMTCHPFPTADGEECGPQCGVCSNGRCVPHGPRCGPCQACNGTDLLCVVDQGREGQPCGDLKVCAGGFCVDGGCPTAPRTQAHGSAAHAAATCEGCPAGLTLCGDQCVDTNEDPDHCGGCFAFNPNGLKCCQGNLCHYINGECCGATCYPEGWICG